MSRAPGLVAVGAYDHYVPTVRRSLSYNGGLYAVPYYGSRPS
ncbi:hypothetical protein ACFWIO_37290 [Streptomyces diastatochromogenes]